MKYTLTDPNRNVLLAVESSPVVTEADMKVDLDKAAKACESAFDEVTKYQDAMAVMSSEGFGEQVKIVASKVWEKIKEAIDRLIGWIKQLIKYIRDGVKSLFDKIGTEDVWSGTAASKTKETFDQLSAKFPEFSQSINDCYKYLTSVVENYKSVDTMVTGK